MIMTIHEVSQRTKLSESTIRRLVQRNEMPLPVQLHGRKRVWSELAINSWLQEKLASAESGGSYE